MAANEELEDLLNSCCSQYAPECAICVDNFCVGDSIVTVPGCKHYFHKECMKGWWNTSSSKKLEPSCPMCKSPARSSVVAPSSAPAAAPSRPNGDLRSALLRVSDEVYVPSSSLSPSPPKVVEEEEEESTSPSSSPSNGPSYSAAVVDDCVAMLREVLRVNIVRCAITQGELRRVRSSLNDQTTPNPYMENTLVVLTKKHRKYRKACRAVTTTLGAINVSLNIDQ